MPHWRRRHHRRRSTRGSQDDRRSSRDSRSFSSTGSSRSGSVEAVALDIVVCHGLYSKYHKPSDTPSQTVDTATSWMEDLLLDFISDSRVMVFDFNYEAKGEKVLSREGCEKAAADLLTELCDEGGISGQGRERPILFIAYDMAGIIVKRALAIANNDEKYQSIAMNTCRILFFGTPHRAVDLRAWEDQLLEIAFSAAKVSKQSLVTLRLFAAWLNEVAMDINSVAGCYSVVNIYDEVDQPGELVVTKFAATLDVPSEEQIARAGDFVTMCKFSKEEPQLDLIVSAVKLEATSQDKDYIRSLWTLGRLGPPGKIPTELYGSFDWIVNHPHYDSWLDSPNVAFLHLYGRRGSWDSDLSVFVFKSLREFNIVSRAVIYYSFDGQDENRNNSAALFTSLTRQLLTLQPSFARIRGIFSLMEKQASWTSDELWILFRSLVFSLDEVEIICVINSLHECDSSRKELLDALNGLRTIDIQFKVLFVSSSRPDVVKSLSSWPQINLDQEAGMQKDVEAFVRQSMRELTHRRLVWKEFEGTTIDTLYTFSDFLLISQAVEVLGAFKGLSTPESISKEINRLPRTLEEFVESAITKIPEWSKTVLLWILHSLRPLKVNELAMVLAVEDDSISLASIENRVPKDLSKDIERAFGPLTWIENGEVRIHWEVQQCLKKENREGNTTSLEAMPNAHWSMAKLCMTYISMKEFEDMTFSEHITKHRLLNHKHFDLLGYAVQHWHAHYRRVSDKSLYSETVINFLSNKKRMQLWSELNWQLGNPVTRQNQSLTHPLHLAAKFGLSDVISILLSRSPGNESDIGDPAFSLELAARSGHLEVVRQLLDHGIDDTEAVMRALNEACARGSPRMVKRLLEDLKSRGKLEFPANLLCRAAQNGYTVIAKNLLQAGAQINAKNEGVTPLHLAGSNGQEAVVECLLAAGADVNALDHNKSTPLFAPSENGYRMEVVHLLKAGATVNIANEGGYTPLHLAARNGQLRVMKLLLDAGADMRATTVSGATPLHFPSLCGNKKSVQMLLDRGLDLETINKQDSDGNTALKLAASSGHETITRTLLTYGADVNLADNSGITPLYASINQGSEAVIELLLANGADPAVRGYSGRTCLMTASQKSLVETVKLLIDKSVDINIRDDDGRTALYFAATEGNDEVTRLLLDRDAEPNSISSNSENPLTQASKGGHDEIVRLLLESGADASVLDSRGQTALQNATNGNHEAVVRMLLDHKANPDNVDGNGRTALHEAAHNGYESIALLLLDRRANPNVKDLIEWTPLHRAASKGHSNIARHILRYSRDTSATDEDGWTALHVAAQNSHVEVMQVLKEFGTDLQAQTYLGETPLHFSAGQPRAAKWLLDQGVGVDPVTESRETPLMRAAARGLPEMIKLFLRYSANPNACNADNSNPLTMACRAGSKEAAEILLDAGANVDTRDNHNNTPLQLAAWYGYTNLTKLLIDRGASINLGDYDGDTALSAASFQGNLAVVKVLLDGQALMEIVNDLGMTALLVAIKGRKQEVAQLLLERGAKSNAVAGDGSTALQMAAANGLEDTVHGLLDHGAEVNATGGKYRTALQAAIASGSETIASDLVKRGADVNAQGGAYIDALSAACAKLPNIVPQLLDANANANIEDSQGRLALHHAARFGRSWTTLLMLVDAGSEPNAVDKQGRNILHHAATGGHSLLVRQLIKSRDVRKQDKHLLSPSIERDGLENIFRSSSPRTERHALDVPDSDGWEALHWACRGDNPKLILLLLDSGADPMVACKRGWTPRHVALFHGQKALVEALERRWRGRRGGKGRRGSEIELAPLGITLSEGLESGKTCNGCFCTIYGIQFHCKECEDFFFCFKCYWSVETTHPGHRFARLGKGPRTGPEWVGAGDEGMSPGEDEEDEESEDEEGGEDDDGDDVEEGDGSGGSG